MEKKIYVECRHGALITAKIRNDKGVVTFEKTFYPFVANKYTGGAVHTGYTEITESEYNMLREKSKVFAHAERTRQLVATNKIPAALLTPAAIAAEKDRQIAELRAELAACKEKLAQYENKGAKPPKAEAVKPEAPKTEEAVTEEAKAGEAKAEDTSAGEAKADTGKAPKF